MSKIKGLTSKGELIVYKEIWLEQAMRKFVEFRHTIDESYGRKRRTGYYIFAKNIEFTQYPFLNYNFSRRTDAKFIIEVLIRKIPYMSKLKLYVKFCPSQRIPETKYEVMRLGNKAREQIWKNFVV